MINPSVFQGPTGTKSTSGASNGQAGRPESMPQAISKLQLRSRAAAWMPRNTCPKKLSGVPVKTGQPASTPMVEWRGLLWCIFVYQCGSTAIFQINVSIILIHRQLLYDSGAGWRCIFHILAAPTHAPSDETIFDAFAATCRSRSTKGEVCLASGGHSDMDISWSMFWSP